MSEIILSINGMTCGGCVNSVTRVLQSVPGVHEVNVSLAPPQAVIRYDASAATPEQFARAVADAGFTVVASQAPSA